MQSKQEIICGDCLPILKSYADKQFDLVLCDPPYGIGVDKNQIGGRGDQKKTLHGMLIRHIRNTLNR